MQDPQTIITQLERAPELIVPLVREFPPGILKRRPKPGKWSAHEHACHLAVVHKLFFTRLERILEQPHPLIESYQPDRDEPEDRLLHMDLDESLERFTTERSQLVARIKRLHPEDWERTAEHPEYSRYSVLIMFRHLALHDLFHAYRIEELLLKKDWE